jgi:D-psicose/D-tagatose/L-ribulose 3-epimerase
VARCIQEYGIQLGLEPCDRYETHLNNAALCVAVIERIGEPNLVCHLDTYHMNIEEKGFGNGCRFAGKYCSYVHISESDRGVPGTGDVSFEDIFKTLAQIKFQGRPRHRIVHRTAAGDCLGAVRLAARRQEPRRC